MITKTIDQFMWAFQHTFRWTVQYEIQEVLSQIGLQIHDTARVFLIGLATRDDLRHQTCIEPEDGPLVVDDLHSIDKRTSELCRADPRYDIEYSIPRVGAQRQHMLLLRSRAQAIADAIHESARFEDLRFFVSTSAPLAGYEIHTCVGIPNRALRTVPPFNNPKKDDYHGRYIEVSLVQSIINTCLHRADMALNLPYPGEGIAALGDRTEIIRTSASRFANGLSFALTSESTDLFRMVSEFSSLTYERSGAKGHLVITHPDNLANKMRITIQSPIGMDEARTVRKMLELTDETRALLTDGQSIYGIGECISAPDTARITIDGHGKWSISVDDNTLMRVSYEHASLPRQILDREFFSDVSQMQIGTVDVERIWAIFQCALGNDRGTTIVVSEDPVSEVARLGQEALTIRPEFLDHEDIARLGRIDGAIVLGSDGRCYAFGVILDGLATSSGDRARGARLNSSIRYQRTSSVGTLVIVISDDGTVDLIPSLMPRVSRREVEDTVRVFCEYSAVEGNNSEEWGRLKRLVDKLSFYLNQEQCDRVNDAFEKEMESRAASGGRRLPINRLHPDPNMNDSYFRG